jgi:phasin family protein
MSNPAEQFAAAHKANLDAFQGSVNQAYAGVEKLVELNMAATKAALGETFGHFQAVLAAKTPQEVLSAQSDYFKPMAQKSAAYLQHVQAIATESNTDFTQQIEAKMAEAQKAFGASVEQLAKNAPAGSEAAIAAFQNALATSQKAAESAQAAIKKATATAQANFAAASKQATDIAKKAAKAA